MEEVIPNRKKIKHNYTSELELKSLLIRIKNKGEDKGTPKDNVKINKYVKWHTAINNKKYAAPAKRNIVKKRIKAKIVQLSESTCVDEKSYEQFGAIILLMIKKILTKPQFSGYTYKDDFYSDAIYKMLKYLNNYDHTLISIRTNQPVNAFAYISQIIHNSILYIIKTKKKESDNLKKLITFERLSHNVPVHVYKWGADDKVYDFKPKQTMIIEDVFLHEIKTSLVDEIVKLEDDIDKVSRMNITYPADYVISFDEYSELKHLLKGKITITRFEEKDE